jgi:3',5'-cyclic-AMP phosphodiesterase
MNKRIFLIVIVLTFFLGCDSPFSYSPFETNLSESLRNTTQKQLERITSTDTASNFVFKIALLSDTHYHYDDLKDAISHINRDPQVSFTIVTGDITENGLKKEFELFHQIMTRLHKPYLTIIGNHDYLSNGGLVYEQMFGNFNYSFHFGGVRFVMFDNVIWESNKAADYEWLSNTLSDAGQLTENSFPQRNHTIVFSHIPPFDGQLTEKREEFHSLLTENHVMLSVHGHKHEYFIGELLGDGIQYMTVGSPQKRSYAMLTIRADQIVVEQIHF